MSNSQPQGHIWVPSHLQPVLPEAFETFCFYISREVLHSTKPGSGLKSPTSRLGGLYPDKLLGWHPSLKGHSHVTWA